MNIKRDRSIRLPIHGDSPFLLSVGLSLLAFMTDHARQI